MYLTGKGGEEVEAFVALLNATSLVVLAVKKGCDGAARFEAP